MLDHPNFVKALAQVAELQAKIGQTRHRYLVVVTGERHSCRSFVTQLLGKRESGRCLWFGEAAPVGMRTLEAQQIDGLLGEEIDALVYDAYAGFKPDAFAALSGSLCGGGLLLLIAPHLDAWPRQVSRVLIPDQQSSPTGDQEPSRYLSRLVRLVQADPNVAIVRIANDNANITALPRQFSTPKVIVHAAEDANHAWHNQEQRQAIEAVVKVATGRRRRPLVLQSDRGRGKSAALGIAAAQLLKLGTQRIIVTAHRYTATQKIFQHARQQLQVQSERHGCIAVGQARLQFMAPDELLREQVSADLVLVDEAAAIPTPLLTQLLKRYARIVFATTVHGYEGTGRGFAVRFVSLLDQFAPGWKMSTLALPIRWAQDDPLEQLVFRALLLNASPAADAALAIANLEQVRVEQVTQARLAGSESLLAQVFGLLVLAHYRTRPRDVHYLLDDHRLCVFVLREREVVIGVLVAVREGGLSADQAVQVWRNESRPHGHVLPESMAAHLGLLQAPQLTALRIMRIAVHPACQRRGLGTQLVQALMDFAAQQRIDYVGSLFGASDGLLQFWYASQFLPIRVSFRRGTSSDAHAVLVMRPCSPAARTLACTARERFLKRVFLELADPLRMLEPRLVVALLATTDECANCDTQSLLQLSEDEWADVVCYACGNKSYEASMYALWRFACGALRYERLVDRLDHAQLTVLVMRVLQRHAWQECALRVAVPGRAQVDQLLRKGFRAILQKHANEAIFALMATFPSCSGASVKSREDS